MDSIEKTFAELEAAISNKQIDEARTELRRWFSLRGASDVEASSISEWLEFFAKSPTEHADVASIAIRCSCVPDLIEPDASNQIRRSVISLAEGALPGLVQFLKIDTKEQNHLKYKTLMGAQNIAIQNLEPIRRPYGDLNSIVGARQTVVGVLGHNGLKDYLRPFGLDEVRSNLENVFGRLSKVAQIKETLLDDVESCQSSIRDAAENSDKLGTFLARNCLTPFLQNVDSVLQEFLKQQHGRFSAKISLAFDGEQLKKRYPLHEANRRIIISVPLRNSGSGRAIDVRVTCQDSDDSIVIDSMTLLLGNVAPGEFEVNFNCLVKTSCQEVHFFVAVEWGEIGSSHRQREDFLIQVLAQSARLDWGSLEYSSPYSTDVVEGDAFVGREDKVRQLAGKILRSPMEPFYVTGQKRVGKTSLAKAAADFAKSKASDFTLHTHYILWGSVADAVPSASLRRLGENIHNFVVAELPKSLEIPTGDYAGSLSDLLQLANMAAQVVPNKRFLIILDEIDEIHEQLYLSGNLASTFFANLRALSRASNIGLVLVGGENTPYIMDRQGQKLNNFSRINLSYFERGTEWNDFRLLVQKPTQDILNWHEEAVSEVYNATSGNPYFAKLICAGVFRKAVIERDADITAGEVRAAGEAEIPMLGSNSFVHLWQDGIPRAVDEREPEVLCRLRVLVALARCLRKNMAPTIDNITKNRATRALLDSEIGPVLNEFCRRGILKEENECFHLALRIFGMWLVDVGVAQLAADGLSEKIADSSLAQENAELVKASEILKLVDDWPTYCGRKVGADDVRAWIEQVPSKSEQRVLFQLLTRVRVFGEPAVREKLKSLHDILHKSLPVFIQKKRNARRDDILVTYVDGPAKSGASYAALYAEENGVLASLVVAPESLQTKYDEQLAKNQDVNAIVIVDDIAATGKTLADLLSEFVSKHRKILEDTKLRAFTLVATPEGQAAVLDKLEEFDALDIDFRSAEILLPSARAFPADLSGWDSKDRREQAQSLCQDLGSRIYKRQPFGFGRLGLLVVFPTTVPNNTLPILHSSSKQDGHPWKPLFPRPVN